MNNKLKIALKCTKYLLVAALIALPFFGPKKTEAKAEEGRTPAAVFDIRCPGSGGHMMLTCYDAPGPCTPQTQDSCVLEEIVVYG